MSALRKIKRVGKKASKFQYTATYQSVVVECQRVDSWKPNQICVSWSRRGRRFFTQKRPWQASPDNKMRGVVIWPEKEMMDITVTLYKSPKDTSYESKEWEFNVIDVDASGKRKILASNSINMVRYASTMPFDHDVQLSLKPVSRKIKKVILDITLCSVLVKEGKATDDDMMSIASMMSVSNLSTIGNLEDDDDDNYIWHGGRSITPPPLQESILSTEELLKWTQEVTAGYRGVKVTNMTTSWRTGMGFLAIVHYYRPDLIDIEAVSPNAIKENNKLAFDLAQHLGISCPLTPNAMISATIPDKLLVTSFLFNMHQYFTRAVPSAIAKDSPQNGNKEGEEAMMREWFSLLNGKNELIKRQIELNIIEREEDLEKKQFFINRELRPLMQIPDDQKTAEQKARADTLVQDLLGIVDERDKLERRKMATSKSAKQESDGFSTAQSQTHQVVHEQQSSQKECVIS